MNNILMSNVSISNLYKQIVINTRPVERAAPLTEHLQAAGFRVAEIPMLALQARAIDTADVTIMRAWLAGDYKALVMVSPTAAASGLALWQKLADHSNQQSYDSIYNGTYDKTSEIDKAVKVNLEPSSLSTPLPSSLFSSLVAPSQLIAVGEATAQVLRQAQLSTASYQVLQPTIANNEGMLAMPEIEQLQVGDKLLIWRGLGGRRLLVDTLQARGVHIDSIAWYERTLPDDALSNYQHWVQASYSQLPAETATKALKPIVIISSGSAFEHWQSVIEQAASAQQSNDNAIIKNLPILVVADFIYVVLGVRLATMLAEQQLDYLQVEDLLPATIVNTIKQQAEIFS